MTTKTDFQTGDRIKFNGRDSDGLENHDAHYTVVLGFDTHVVALFEGQELPGKFLLLAVSGCKKRRFRYV